MSTAAAASQNKLNELLEAIRQEFANVSQEANTYRLQNQKDYDYKINQHLAEMQQIRNTVYELELSHRKLKDSYQEEINRLKLELNQKDQQIASLSQHAQSHVPSTTNTTTSAPQDSATMSTANVATATPNVAVTANITGQAAGSASLPQPNTAATPGTATNTNGPTLAPLISALGSQLQPLQVPGQQQQVPPQQPAAQLQQQVPEATTQQYQPAVAAAAPVVAAPTVTEPQDQATKPKEEVEKNDKEHYLVPFDQRASQLKAIPPFLLDLDAQQVPAHLKKLAEDYYILYNPALPRNLDVELHASLDHSSVVCCVKFSNDGEYLATGCNKTSQIYKVSTGELIAKLSDDNANSAVSSNNNDQNAPANVNGANANSGNNTNSNDLYIRSVCFSPDGKFLATGAEDKLIRIWDIQQRKIVMVLQGHDQDVYSLDYFPSGDKLVSGSGDRTVRIWDLKTGQCSLTLSIEDGVTTVAVSPGDGKFIAAGSLDRAVRVWDSETGFLVERLDSENELGTGHKDSVYSVVFTKDGNKVVSGSLDRSVKLWNLRDNNANSSSNNSNKSNATCDVTYVGHKDFVLSVTTTANDEYILSGSKDRGVLFWDTKSGNPLLMLQGHRNSVISVAVANRTPLGPKYQVFATGSGDCRARIWKFSKIDDTENSENKITEV
ncbi:hypothetical protein KAFR_0C04740 [Kazachstania africana CBS 2517]|uniref:General transcriptional corepressor TUP1 n=1 Tax=Kazachstania africana (strain ATCC 22294 / BCRC 22015 / CBS 2517 / CECT 1963 / NBRC 1671 / NRRL Y-8276) TaxID=1071382 RepID=H2ASW5_KAZAF|nr:hypothetical protein KAFR_0C04740 [Kazachstania africana CBS 2517]CCF57465.1 hypothetical protein KAFR_0C04740 [Kazachstania africana CBS 2517]